MATIPLATGVGWVVSPVIKLMFEKVQLYISTQYKWQSNLEDDLKKLETILTEILLVVGTAERQRTLDCNQQALLCQLKDAVYDAEDILDEFDYMLLKANAEKGKLKSFGSIGRQKERDELVNQLLEQADRPKSRSKGERSASPEALQYGGTVHYVMHDLMNDLAVHISNGGEFCVENAKAQGLEVLKDKNELQDFLMITSLENVKNKNEASNAQLVNKSQISRLKLQWGSSSADNKSDEEYGVLNALRPHPGLEELDLRKSQTSALMEQAH
ncbi:hypothetical protein E2562_004585 [Oryza meyeriana var. granulata]|uniref:Uncharacterized protein n=1 Tax=Oryza meyeriana var. granulata TaxID=110450 RepID=A0A6G1F3K3_9ORYZ|nr:hypothetical protein E2562_004585 [Oryza meyeriana var. granulata]